MVVFRAKAIRRGVSFPSRSFCYPLISPSHRKAEVWSEGCGRRVALMAPCPTRKKWAPCTSKSNSGGQEEVRLKSESVNEGTTQGEKVPRAFFFFKVAPLALYS